MIVLIKGKNEGDLHQLMSKGQKLKLLKEYKYYKSLFSENNDGKNIREFILKNISIEDLEKMLKKFKIEIKEKVSASIILLFFHILLLDFLEANNIIEEINQIFEKWRKTFL